MRLAMAALHKTLDTLASEPSTEEKAITEVEKGGQDRLARDAGRSCGYGVSRNRSLKKQSPRAGVGPGALAVRRIRGEPGGKHRSFLVRNGSSGSCLVTGTGWSVTKRMIYSQQVYLGRGKNGVAKTHYTACWFKDVALYEINRV